MPATNVLFYQDTDGCVPVLEWLRELRSTDSRGFAKCVVRIEQLAAEGHALRRPAADYLRDGIYELRAKHGRVQYRILFFFHGQQVAVLGHALIKKGSAVPAVEIDRAIKRKLAFERDPARHTYEGEV